MILYLLLSEEEDNNSGNNGGASSNRRDLGPAAVYSDNGNLLSVVTFGGRADITYDEFDRPATFVSTVFNEPNDMFSITYTYISNTNDNIDEIDYVTLSSIGTPLNGNITFKYDGNNISDDTTGTFQGSVVLGNGDETISQRSSSYDVTYNGPRLIQNIINTTGIDDDTGNSFLTTGTLTVRYSATTGAVSELDLATPTNTRFIGRRENVSGAQQNLNIELIGITGSTTIRNEVALYNNTPCTTSNQLLERNQLLLSQFIITGVALLQPEFCR